MPKLVLSLLLLLASPAWAQSNPLFDAVTAGDLAQITRLLGAGDAVNARNAAGETPLYVGEAVAARQAPGTEQARSGKQLAVAAHAHHPGAMQRRLEHGIVAHHRAGVA